MKPKVNRIALALGLLLLAGCTRPGKGVKSCRYLFKTLTFTGIDAQQSHWQVDVMVSNPNAHDVTLTRMRYALLHRADTLLSGWNPEKRVVPAKDSLLVRTSLDLPNALWKRLPPDIWSQTDAEFRILADVYLNTWMGDVVAPGAIRETVHINVPEQVAKYKEMLMRKFFSWPGGRSNEAATQGGAPPQAQPRAPGTAPQDGHL